MPNYVGGTVKPNDIFLEGKRETRETISHGAAETIEAGTLMARTDATSAPYTAGDIVVYDSVGTVSGSDSIIGVMDFDVVFAASGSQATRLARAGDAVIENLKKHDAVAISKAEQDSLIANTNINTVSVLDANDYQN